MELTQKRLKYIIDYNPETGVFTNRVNSRTNIKGENAGYSDNNGYLQITLLGNRYLLHRLAFLYMDGYLPEYQVDHLNGVRSDNRWCNLRHVSRMCNMQNQKKHSNNSSGFPGVTWNKRNLKWQACACVRSKHIHLGIHRNKLDAALARLTWEIQCDKWTCNHQGVLIKQIKKEWPEFNLRSVE